MTIGHYSDHYCLFQGGKKEKKRGGGGGAGGGRRAIEVEGGILKVGMVTPLE